MSKKEIQINENLSFTSEEGMDFNSYYLIFISNISSLLVEDNKVVLTLIDKVEKQKINSSFNLYPYQDGYVIEDVNLYYKKLIVESLMDEQISFSLKSIPVIEYRELIYKK